MKIERNEKRGGFYFEDKKSYRVECTKEYLYSILEYLKLTFNKSPRAPFFFTSQVYIYIYMNKWIFRQALMSLVKKA